MTVSPRRAREIARTRQDILEAAARAFTQNGFKAVTVQEIAKEAGYTAASLYSYFSSKEEIIQGLGDMILTEMESAFDMPLPDGISFKEKVRILLARQLEVAQRRYELMALIYVGGGFSDIDRSIEIHRKRLDLYVEFFKRHATEEDLGGKDPRDVALMISGTCGMFFFNWFIDPKEGWLDEKLPMILDVILRGLKSDA